MTSPTAPRAERAARTARLLARARSASLPLVLAIVTALVSVGVLQWRHHDSRVRFAMSASTLDNVLQARLHATRAYMIASNAAAGDANFRLADAVAATDRAVLAVEDWLAGNTGRLERVAPARRDPELRALLLRYAMSLERFRALLLGESRAPEDLVEVRTAFAELEAHHDLIERRSAALLAALDRRERQDHAVSVFLLTGLILGAGLTVDVVMRARERAARELHRHEAQLALVVEQLPAITWTTDRDLTIRSIGGRFVAGISTAHPLPGEVRDHLRNADPGSEVVTAHRNALEGRSASYHFESGGKRFEARVEPLHDGGGPVGVVGVALDVTERDRYEERLRQAHKMEAVGRVAAGAAHDFSNLLAVIRSNAELLRMDLPTDGEQRESIDEILSATTRGTRLVKELMTVGRRQPVTPQALDLARLADEMRPALQRLAGPEVRLAVEAAHDLPRVAADQTQMEQVLLNLVANARDAMPDGGHVTLRVGRASGAEGSRVRLVVADTGHGMDEETRARIFEPFYTTKGPDRGTGLGMATVYGIVRQAGGSISVDSAPGAGATITVELPVSLET